ncbi:DUF1642 domain-containing protein [Enterococcus faecalis]|nr:DUF1642 domain-containing protein [Enterococcus faecalis]NSM92045.1 DUF1642 domain-containing protein [Enterococcus faecalis]
MNKQELIDILENLECSTESLSYDNGYEQGVYDSLSHVILLDEPKKVVVPKFVAEYIEIRKRHYEVGGLGAAIIKVLRSCNETDLASWMNNNTEVFARAWLDGYEVETEQLYYVDFINDGDVHKRLILDHENGKHNIVDWSDNLIGLVQEIFTEQEIKAIDERYWPFAVKVGNE